MAKSTEPQKSFADELRGVTGEDAGAAAGNRDRERTPRASRFPGAASSPTPRVQALIAGTEESPLQQMQASIAQLARTSIATQETMAAMVQMMLDRDRQWQARIAVS